MEETETGFYYLHSRYYDPEIGRFINADGYDSTSQGVIGHNMFAYCSNNPVRYCDFEGSRPIDALSVSSETKKQRERSFDYMNQQAQEKQQNKPDYEPTPVPDPVPVPTPEDLAQEALRQSGIATYRGVTVVQVGEGDSAFSYGVIFGGEIALIDDNLIRHEYGHTRQLKELGFTGYATTVLVPSVTGFVLTEAGVLPREVYHSLPWEYKADEFGGESYRSASKAKSVSDVYWIASKVASALLR